MVARKQPFPTDNTHARINSQYHMPVQEIYDDSAAEMQEEVTEDVSADEIYAKAPASTS